MAMVAATATITPAGTITCRTDCNFNLITGQNIALATQIGPNVYELQQGYFTSQFHATAQTPLPGGALLFGSAILLVVALMGRRAR